MRGGVEKRSCEMGKNNNHYYKKLNHCSHLHHCMFVLRTVGENGGGYHRWLVTRTDSDNLSLSVVMVGPFSPRVGVTNL